MSANTFESQEATLLTYGDVSIYMTITDAEQIRIALLQALRNSEIGDRDELIALTEPLPAWIDIDGRVMVGGWLLQLKQDQLIATYRLSENEERAVGYVASVMKVKNEWQVIDVLPEKILFRR